MMPIPDDPMERWWVEASGANPQRVEQLRPALLAFLAFGPGRQPSLAGTGFTIAGSPEFAAAITAKHVLTEGVGRVQNPYARHAPSALFHSSSPPLTLDPQKLKIVWMGTHRADMMNVGHVGYNESLDAACCIVTPQEGEAARFEPVAIPIDTAVPEVGELVHMVSLDGMIVTERMPPSDPSGAGHELGLTRRVSIRVGVVTGVYPGGLRHYRWPCFTTSIPAEPGMSGGFVFLPREGKTISACGIVCADNSPEEARANFRECGESIVGSTWPMLALRVPDSIPSSPDTTTLTLFQMMRDGRMPSPVGGLDHVDIVGRENGDCTVLLRSRGST